MNTNQHRPAPKEGLISVVSPEFLLVCRASKHGGMAGKSPAGAITTAMVNLYLIWRWRSLNISLVIFDDTLMILEDIWGYFWMTFDDTSWYYDDMW